MMLSSIDYRARRLQLPEHRMRDALHAGRVRNVVLRGVTPGGFRVEADYEADTGMLVPAVLVTRAGIEKAIKCPERAMACLQRMGVGAFTVDVTAYDPAEAFNPTRESTLSRQRRQRHEETLEHYERLVPGFANLDREARLERLVLSLSGAFLREADIRVITLSWLDVYLSHFPTQDYALRGLRRFIRSSLPDTGHADIESEWLERAAADEFTRRRKNQYPSSLVLEEC